MLKWLRNKLADPIYVDCYTKDAAALATAKFKPAIRAIPKWWRNLSTTVDAPIFEGALHATVPQATMRNCVGFIDLYKKSFCVPMPCDLQLYVGPQGSSEYYWRYSDGKGSLRPHPPLQMGEFMDGGAYQHFQLQSPWMLHCEEDVSFLMFDPFWHDGDDPDRVVAPPGVINFKYQSGLNCNIFVKKHVDEPRSVLIRYDSTLAFLLPITERKVIFRYSFMTPEDEAKLFQPRVGFSHSYALARQTIKSEVQAKCPMGLK